MEFPWSSGGGAGISPADLNLLSPENGMLGLDDKTLQVLVNEQNQAIQAATFPGAPGPSSSAGDKRAREDGGYNSWMGEALAGDANDRDQDDSGGEDTPARIGKKGRPMTTAAVAKATREKARREKLNDCFEELAKLCDPSGRSVKNDRVSVIADAIRVLSQLRVENSQLKQLNKFLEERVGGYERARAQAAYQQAFGVSQAQALAAGAAAAGPSSVAGVPGGFGGAGAGGGFPGLGGLGGLGSLAGAARGGPGGGASGVRSPVPGEGMHGIPSGILGEGLMPRLPSGSEGLLRSAQPTPEAILRAQAHAHAAGPASEGGTPPGARGLPPGPALSDGGGVLPQRRSAASEGGGGVPRAAASTPDPAQQGSVGLGSSPLPPQHPDRDARSAGPPGPGDREGSARADSQTPVPRASSQALPLGADGGQGLPPAGSPAAPQLSLGGVPPPGGVPSRGVPDLQTLSATQVAYLNETIATVDASPVGGAALGLEQLGGLQGLHPALGGQFGFVPSGLLGAQRLGLQNRPQGLPGLGAGQRGTGDLLAASQALAGLPAFAPKHEQIGSLAGVHLGPAFDGAPAPATTAAGGMPQQLSWLPAPDVAQDGKMHPPAA